MQSLKIELQWSQKVTRYNISDIYISMYPVYYLRLYI